MIAFRWCLFGVLIAMALHVETANAYTLPAVRAPLMKAPVIDGVFNEDEWSGATRMERFGRAGVLVPQAASFWLGTDGTELFVAVKTETPPDNALKATVSPGPGDTDARTYLDDSVELVVDPERAGGKTDRTIFHAIFNAKGAVYDQAYRNGGALPWRANWRIGNTVRGNTWTCEVAIPWKDLGVQGNVLGQEMGIRIVRTWKQSSGPSQTEWSPLGGAYLAPETLPVVTWDAGAPVVQMLGLKDATGRGRLELSVSNPGQQPLRLKASLETRPRNSAPVQVNEPIVLNPGAKRLVELPFSSSDTEELFSRVKVTGENGLTYHVRDWNWTLEQPANLWDVQAKEKTPYQAQFAYFPTSQIIKVKVDMEGFIELPKVRGVRLSLLAENGAKALKTVDMPPLQGKATQMEWPVGGLPEGQYQLQVQPIGVEAASLRLPFVRHHFGWENNQLGQSRIVLPEFTPLQVRGNTVSTILRDHIISPEGLWTQVSSLGEPLLKSPMRLEVRSGGKDFLAKGEGAKFGERLPDRVSSASSWKAGPVSGASRATWDYDGVMRCELELAPTKTLVDGVTLVIPLDDKQMSLMHTCTDGLRFNYAGLTPKGNGVVWDSTKAPHNSILGSFVPYIWLGGEERGFSVFADNDKGWIPDPKRPAQELIRKPDGTLELRLNFVSQAGTWSEPRKITFGFQATPVKPMPQNWRLWTVTGKEARRVPGSFQQLFMPSGYYWGTLTAAADIYPRGEDFSLFKTFADLRKTGVEDKPFLENWLINTKAPTPADEKQYRVSLQWAYAQLKKRPENVLLYTNARGVRYDTPEGQTFLDEWHRDQFPTRSWKYGGGAFYDLDPVSSYRDYAAFYYDKMLRSFADSIYFDDVFLQSNFDTVGTDAYVRPDGNIQPSSGVWNMKALIRRTAILGQETGHPSANMVHMTNSAISPIMSFAQSHLTWEDRSGDTDFQDRFSREYIRAESIGRQFGTVPFALGLIKSTDPAKATWAGRTMSGVLLTHEIKPWGATQPIKEYWDTYDRLVALGYGSPGTNVWNYWQPNVPVTITGGETSFLVVNHEKRTFVIVCDYGNGAELKMKFKPTDLNLTGNLIVTNVETNQELPVSENEVQLTLKKHDFTVIELKQRDP